ncbi:alpha/beta hydrolase [Microbacterium schleiferi]|uniref:alpha/beta fold hydrolase n=1 Tax=Microbacterium schleiferi TaxID=69362 RepID=UPI00311EA207
MHIILIPGLWLDASSWDDVVPALRDADHEPHPVTLPGVGEPADASGEIGIADWVDAVVNLIDGLEGDVVLVGHSGGGNVAWGAADRRVDRVARVILVDTLPPTPGGMIWEFPIVDGVVPFPGWETFETPEVRDLSEAVRAEVAQRALSVPARVPTDAITLTDEGRHRVPMTILMGTASADEISGLLEEPPAWAAELAASEHLSIVEIDAGHWPQFSVPDQLARHLISAIRET